MTNDVISAFFEASGAGVSTFSDTICSVAFSLATTGSVSVGTEGPALVSAWIVAASTSACFVSALGCALEASGIFLIGA
jgi:hypothetical protein